MFNVVEFKNKLAKSGLSYRQVCEATDLGHNWIKSVVAGRFESPNPHWIKKIERFLEDYEQIKQK